MRKKFFYKKQQDTFKPIIPAFHYSNWDEALKFYSEDYFLGITPEK